MSENEFMVSTVAEDQRIVRRAVLYLVAQSVAHVLVGGLTTTNVLSGTASTGCADDAWTNLWLFMFLTVCYGVMAVGLQATKKPRVATAIMLAQYLLAVVDLLAVMLAFVNVVPDESVSPVAHLVADVLIWSVPVLDVVGIMLVTRAHQAFERVYLRVTEPQEAGPELRYCQALSTLMARVMNADGRVNSQEAAAFDRALDEWNLSKLQKKLLLKQGDESIEQMSDLVAQALERGKQVSVQDPAEDLVMKLIVVARCDGTMVPEEKALIEQTARLAGMDEPHLHSLMGL